MRRPLNCTVTQPFASHSAARTISAVRSGTTYTNQTQPDRLRLAWSGATLPRISARLISSSSSASSCSRSSVSSPSARSDQARRDHARRVPGCDGCRCSRDGGSGRVGAQQAPCQLLPRRVRTVRDSGRAPRGHRDLDAPQGPETSPIRRLGCADFASRPARSRARAH